jgi:iron complex transport system permease protein
MTRILIPVLTALLVVLSAVSLLAGTIWLSPGDVLAGFADPKPDLAQLIIVDVRLPRLVLALLVGGILGLSGAVLQGLLRNPLAEPGLLGVSSGASLGAVIAIYYGFAASFALATPLFALAGAMIAIAVALALSRTGGTMALILAGVAVSSLAGSGVSLALNFAPSPYAAYEIMTWLMGSLSDRSWDHVLLAGPFILVGAALLLTTGRALDALALGERQAESLGMDLMRIRMLAMFGTALGVGAATAVTGAIGFVGLIAPHLVRPLVGHRPGASLVPSSLTGAAIVLAADIATRLLRFGPELRLGVLSAIVGAPFFLWLVLHVRRTAP